jgi:hypothetical protein
VLDYYCHHHIGRKQQAAFRKKWGLSYEEALSYTTLEELDARITA